MTGIKDPESILGTLAPVHTETLPETGHGAAGLSFMEIASRFADLEGTVVLASGSDHDCARHHILAVSPWMIFRSFGLQNRLFFPGKNASADLAGDPLELLRRILQHYRSTPAAATPITDPDSPVSSGLFGYLSYDLKAFIERLPKTVMDVFHLPLLVLAAPSAILVEDRRTGSRLLHLAAWKPPEEFSKETGENRGPYPEPEPGAVRRFFFDRLQGPPASSPADAAPSFSGDENSFFSSFSRKTYMAAVERIKQYIVSGHIYQANLSQRFEGAFYGSAFAMFRALFETAPAPFYAYVNAGDHQVVSTSPERFLLRSGRRVETRPIKGTRPRGATPEADRENAEALLASAKDDAELSMIVDLMRNDLGRVCEGGSVRVSEHRRLESYKNVFHLVSVVEGTLGQDKDSVDLLLAAFPGGSITGCPRIRAMEIIDELEPCMRHIYTGSIGYIGFNDTMDLSIAIRTATITGGRICFSVGGGVVYDSDPADEYEETLHKGRSIRGMFEKKDCPPEEPPAMVWFNGVLVPAGEVRFGAGEKGVRYGYGFFETIRADRGHPDYLEEHMARFSRTWKTLFSSPPPDMTWREIVRQVISANGLQERLALVRISAACIDDETTPVSANITVTAEPATHRLSAAGKDALDVAVYPHPRQTPLADHKTLNYLYYYLAGKWAKQNGSDEAVILNPDGSVSETNTANIICIRGDCAVIPASPHVLAGIMADKVTAFLRDAGWRVAEARISEGDLTGFDAVFLTNSLLGAAGVRSVDGRPVPVDKSLCNRINRHVLAPPKR